MLGTPTTPDELNLRRAIRHSLVGIARAVQQGKPGLQKQFNLGEHTANMAITIALACSATLAARITSGESFEDGDKLEAMIIEFARQTNESLKGE